MSEADFYVIRRITDPPSRAAQASRKTSSQPLDGFLPLRLWLELIAASLQTVEELLSKCDLAGVRPNLVGHTQRKGERFGG